jgi:superfamily II DNA or RNA helicase
MLQSLSMKDYPDGTFSSFGLTIIDEVHHISSEVFSCALFKIVTKYMLGLSATMNRKDGTTKVFKMFLGDVVYKGDRDQEHDVIVRGIQYRSDDDDFNSIVTNFRGDIIYSTMISKLCGYNRRSEFILHVLSDMLKENNEQQIMILAHNKSLLTYLYDAIDARKIASVGYYVGGMKEAALKESETKKVVIATYSMASEALDIKTLTTLIMATPKTDIEQSIGRILRQRHTNPIVVDIIDQHEPFIRQWYKRLKFYKKHNYQIIQTTSTNYTPDTTQWKSAKPTPSKNVSKKTTVNTQETVLQQLLNNSGVVEDGEYTQGNDSDNDSGDELFQDPNESRKNTGSRCLI